MNTRFTVVTLTAALTLSAAQAQTCNPSITRSAPDSRYQLVVGSGGIEVLDTQTKLIWQRCSIGQTWNGTTCIGTAATLTWHNALQQAKNYGSAWRLPNIKELQSLVEEACHHSAINQTFFPTTLSVTTPSGYWSASPNRDLNNFAWVVSFGNGNTDNYAKSSNVRVRAVRASQ